MADIESMKDKIAKLLAKAERTTNEHEALAFREAAEKYMVKWGIEIAELESRGETKPEEIISRVIDLNGIYAAAFSQFAYSLVKGIGNLQMLKSFRYNEKHKKVPTVYIIGYISDVDRWEMLYNSLYIQAMSEMNRWWKSSSEREFLSGMEGYKARREFIMAFGRAVGTRLAEARREEKKTGGISTGAELVLASKEKAVNDWMYSQYSIGRSRGRGIDSSYYGRDEGHAAGSRASLGGKGISGSGSEIGR